MTSETFHYAMENTHVIVPPRRSIATLGDSHFNYFLVTEDMDQVNLSHVREGSIRAERPQLLTPEYFRKFMLEGFGKQAEQFAQAMQDNPEFFTLLKYGFRVKKDEIRSYQLHEPMAEVTDKVTGEVAARNDPLSTVLIGIDDAWEVCLLKFMMEMVQKSAPGNFKHLRDEGFLD